MIHSPAPFITLSAWRSRFLFILLLLGFVGLAVRAAYLQGMHNDFLRQKGESRYSRIVEMSANRGMITDRHGEVLAISTPVASIYVDPTKVQASNEQLNELAMLLKMDVTTIQQRIAEQQRRFVYLQRRVLPGIAERIEKLKIPGVFLQSESQRFYPAGEMTAHVLGFTNIDDKGQEGVELAWQDTLTGELGSRRVIKDRKGQIIEDIENIRAPRQGQDLVLSLDSGIQYLAHRELTRAVTTHRAKAGSIVILDAQTGEILAMVNLPVYNPNRRTSIDQEKIRNRALIDTFEPGSTLKPFAVAVAMEVGEVNADTIVQTAPGTLRIGRRTIRDINNKGNLTVAQVIQQSSNIGTAKIALALPPQTLWEMLNRSGFGMSTGLGFPGEASGRLRAYNTWRPIEQATMSYGHGISVNLLQLARAYTLFTSGGELQPVSLLKRDSAVMGQRVISAETALAMSLMLELAVQPGGTATLAQVNGYRVAGKTGTAHKLIDGNYARNRYISSFVGYAPASNPRLIIAVMIDEPSAGQYYGGLVAAPVFSQVMAGALRMLNVPHDASPSNVVFFPAVSGFEEGG
ncbi:MAG: penicillin-binding transpeptidase domain-containing protein [Nitrosomonas sp.]|nr:penicillin-binding transpeptidase domain-containing protein [Nitrosomonas sp.]MDP1949632.1 penicillin-binding transpeptidase domain-containing protein [Nitrosomonas sp.]